MVEKDKSRKESLTILRNQVVNLLGSQGIYFALVLVLVLARFISPAFYQSANIFNLLRQASALGILSIGQTIVMIGGGIDLSVAATMQLTTIGIAELTKSGGVNVGLAVIVVLLMSALVGAINGFVITRYKVPPFVATLFVGSVITGIRLVYTKATPSGVLPPAIRIIGRDATGPFPNAALLFIILAVIAHTILRTTTFGRKLFATGGSIRSAWLSGVATNRILMSTYILSGVLAGIGGLVLAGYVGYADQWIGRGYDLDSVAAVVIGGTSFSGGQGSISGTVTGVLLVTILLNLVLLLNLNVQWQLVVKGFVIIIAVALYSFNRKAH